MTFETKSTTPHLNDAKPHNNRTNYLRIATLWLMLQCFFIISYYIFRFEAWNFQFERSLSPKNFVTRNRHSLRSTFVYSPTFEIVYRWLLYVLPLNYYNIKNIFKPYPINKENFLHWTVMVAYSERQNVKAFMHVLRIANPLWQRPICHPSCHDFMRSVHSVRLGRENSHSYCVVVFFSLSCVKINLSVKGLFRNDFLHHIDETKLAETNHL